MRKRSRRFSTLLKQIDKNKYYAPIDALDLFHTMPRVNFIETVEAHIVLGLDPKYAEMVFQLALRLQPRNFFSLILN